METQERPREASCAFQNGKQVQVRFFPFLFVRHPFLCSLLFSADVYTTRDVFPLEWTTDASLGREDLSFFFSFFLPLPIPLLRLLLRLPPCCMYTVVETRAVMV